MSQDGRRKEMESRASELHQEAIVIDATCPLASVGNYFEKWMAGGTTVIAPTVNRPGELMRETMTRVGEWFRKLRLNQDKLLLVTSVEDIFKAKREEKLGLLFHFQGTMPFEKDLNSIEIFYRLGVRMVQLCYNVRDFVGDGCAERTDSGLSDFGIKVVEELNRLGIVIDCSHTGYRTTMEAIEVSKKPVIASHSNVNAVCASFRNLKDDQIKALAKKGGVIGLNGTPYFVTKKNRRPTLDDLLDHADHIARLVGVEHVSVGIDYYEGTAGVADDKTAKMLYDQFLEAGIWSPRDYAPPPWYLPEGIEMPDKLPNLTAGLLKRGYSEEDVKKILGLNLIRVFKETWL
jgi:membrane dipeptidase